MNILKVQSIYSILLLISACSDTVQVGENTFIRDNRVFRIIDNEITELGDLSRDKINKSEILNSNLKDFGTNKMDFIKEGVHTDFSAVYRGDILYYKLKLHGLNELRSKYKSGGLSINFLDSFGFLIHNTNIELSEMIRIIGNDGETLHFEFNGKSQMSSEVYSAIYTYSISSFLNKNGSYSW